MYASRKVSKRCVISLFFVLYYSTHAWVHEYSIEQLHNKFRFDPLCPGYAKELEKKPERVQQLKNNYERAVYAFIQMGFDGPTPYIIKEYCYRFAECLEDPLCHTHMHEIKQMDPDNRLYKMAQNLAVLENRNLFVKYIRWKAKTAYQEAGIDPALQQKLLNIIWETRYLFANVMSDPWIDFIIHDLPQKQKIPERLQEILILRNFRVKAKMDEWQLDAANPEIERTLYCLLDQLDVNPEPRAVIDHLKIYNKDKTPHIYQALFTKMHVNRCNTYDLSLLEGLEVPDEIASEQHVDLRSCYENLLLLPVETTEQRDIVRICLRIIIHACTTKKDKHLYKQLAQELFESLAYVDADKTIFHYPTILNAILQEDKRELLNSLIKIISQLKEPARDKQQLIDQLKVHQQQI